MEVFPRRKGKAWVKLGGRRSRRRKVDLSSLLPSFFGEEGRRNQIYPRSSRVSEKPRAMEEEEPWKYAKRKKKQKRNEVGQSLLTFIRGISTLTYATYRKQYARDFRSLAFKFCLLHSRIPISLSLYSLRGGVRVKRRMRLKWKRQKPTDSSSAHLEAIPHSERGREARLDNEGRREESGSFIASRWGRNETPKHRHERRERKEFSWDFKQAGRIRYILPHFRRDGRIN